MVYPVVCPVPPLGMPRGMEAGEARRAVIVLTLALRALLVLSGPYGPYQSDTGPTGHISQILALRALLVR